MEWNGSGWICTSTHCSSQLSYCLGLCFYLSISPTLYNGYELLFGFRHPVGRIYYTVYSYLTGARESTLPADVRNQLKGILLQTPTSQSDKICLRLSLTICKYLVMQIFLESKHLCLNTQFIDSLRGVVNGTQLLCHQKTFP